MKTLYKHGGSHRFKKNGKGKSVPEMTPEQIKARDEYVAKLRKKREEQDKIKTQVDEELFGYAGGGKYYPHGGKHEEEGGILRDVGDLVMTIPRAAGEVGSDVMQLLQSGYNKATGRGPKEIPAEEFKSTNMNYGGMDEVVDWMLEQKAQGMGPNVEAPSLERLRSGESRDPNAINYMPAPSPDDIERKAMMFSNAFDAARNMNASFASRGLNEFGQAVNPMTTDEKRANIMKIFKEQGIPEEWQNEFFDAFRKLQGSIVATDPGINAPATKRPDEILMPPPGGTAGRGIQGSTQPIQMPQTRRRGLFRRR